MATSPPTRRRFMIVPPAVPSGGHAEQLEGQAKEFPCLQLETANMRVSGSLNRDCVELTDA